MSMCFRCRGACCEEFFVRSEHDLVVPSSDHNKDINRWFKLHGTKKVAVVQATSDTKIVVHNESLIHFECKCTKLTGNGKCSIYETRPDICKALEAGSDECLSVVRRRRTEWEYEYITTGKARTSS